MIPLYQPQPLDSAGLVASLVVKTVSGRLFRLFVTNNNAATRYIQIFDATALPADGAVPNLVAIIPAATTNILDLGIYGRPFANGIVVCNSTTLATKTIGSADSWFDVLFT